MFKQRLSSLFALLPILGALQFPVSTKSVRKTPPPANGLQIILSTDKGTLAAPLVTTVAPGQYTSITPTQSGKPEITTWQQSPQIVSAPTSRNLLYTPEDAARFKVAHPFLTPEIQGQVRIIPVRRP